jgi:hypothetical protein
VENSGVSNLDLMHFARLLHHYEFWYRAAFKTRNRGSKNCKDEERAAMASVYTALNRMQQVKVNMLRRDFSRNTICVAWRCDVVHSRTDVRRGTILVSKRTSVVELLSVYDWICQSQLKHACMLCFLSILK